MPKDNRSKKNNREIYIPEYLDTLAKAMYVLDNPEVYEEYLKRDLYYKELKSEIKIYLP